MGGGPPIPPTIENPVWFGQYGEGVVWEEASAKEAVGDQEQAGDEILQEEKCQGAPIPTLFTNVGKESSIKQTTLDPWSEGTVFSRRLVKEMMDRALEEATWKVQMEEEEVVMEEAAREYEQEKV